MQAVSQVQTSWVGLRGTSCEGIDLTALDYLKSQACTIAWVVAKPHGLAAMVEVLHVLRNRAERLEEWDAVLGAAWLSAIAGYTGDRPSLRDPEFKRLLDIVDQIVTELQSDEQGNILPAPRPSSVGKALIFSERPCGGAMHKIGGLYFW